MKKYIKKIRVEIILQIFFSTIGSLSLAMLAYLPKIVFDSLTNVTSRITVLVIAAFCILSIISIIASYFEMLFNWKYAVKFENSIKNDYFKAVIQYDDIEFHKREISDYISIQSNDIMQIEQDYLTPMVSAINQIIKLIIFGIIMFFGIDYRIALVIFIASFISAILPKYTGSFTSSKRLSFVNALSRYTNIIYDFFTGFRQINSRTAKQLIDRHVECLDETTTSRYNYGMSKSISLSINSAARTIVQILGFVMAIVLLIKGEISIGTSVATLGFISSFINPLEETLYCFTTMETVKDVKNKVFGIIQSDKQDYRSVKKDFAYNLVVNNLCSHNGTFKLENITLVFEKNMKYALIGNNGSGKTTLLNTIMGYVPIDSGEILIDGSNLSRFDLAWLVTYVLQKSHIFSANYSNNVTMFQSYNDLSNDLIQKIGLKQEIVNKIKTQDKSTELSGGEQQIVAYMRARNSGTPILIMDEPFSAVDKDSKLLLMKDLASLKDKTIIMITHDVDESLCYFDKVFQMNSGSLTQLENASK